MTKKYIGRLLLVDDDVETMGFWICALNEEGFLADGVNSLDEMKESISRVSYDAVVLDLDLGKENGLDGLPYLLANSPFSKVFILTGHGSIDTAVQAIERGASGYVTKDMPPAQIASQIYEKIKKTEFQLRDHEDDKDLFRANGLIGASPRFNSLCETIMKVRNVDSTIIILGESGTGKEIVARCIHSLSGRAKNRFEAINCAAIPEALLESEMFGHRKGAFTDAKQDRKGIFELCSDGTLLLDEIGDMPLILQAKLLRVLQERVVTPIGSSTSIKVNTRVIAATHRDLVEEVQSGRFREDLYHRLSVVPLQVPPLRHRKEDIKLLVEHFRTELNKRFSREIKPANGEVMNRIMAYDWPGNIRELRNAVERAIVLSGNDEINISDMFQHLNQGKKETTRNSSLAEGSPEFFELSLTEAKAAFEKAYVEFYLKQQKGNISEVAKKSGRYRVDIYRLIEKYGINQNEFRD